jgi:CO/xanthine dehydrogenase FAD-binding subunit
LFNQRQGDFAIVAVAALLALDSHGRVSDLRLAVGGVSEKPIRFDDVSNRFLTQRPDEKWMMALADTVQAVCEIEETRISAIFRRELLQVLTRRATTAALRRAREASRP